MRVLAIAGSLRAGSHNRRLLEAARRRAAEREDLEVEILDRELLRELPYFDEDAEADPGPEVERFRSRVREADAILIATPEYNHSIPGVLKNALDWASRPTREAALGGKPAAVIGASTSRFGAVWAQAETRKVLSASGARVLEDELPVAQAQLAFDEAGEPLADDLAGSLDELLAKLAEQVRERELLAA